MSFSKFILKTAGWKVNITVPNFDKCLICVAPHTSNWDFIIGKLAYRSVGRDAGFLMKSTWFFPPMGWIFRAIGGIPVYRNKKPGAPSLTQQIVRKFKTMSRLQLAITPEGTRRRVGTWHTGFLHIAWDASVPVCLGVIDFATRTVTIDTVFTPTGNTEADMEAIKSYYRAVAPTGRNPQNFTAD